MVNAEGKPLKAERDRLPTLSSDTTDKTTHSVSFLSLRILLIQCVCETEYVSVCLCIQLCVCVYSACVCLCVVSVCLVCIF